MTDTQAAPRDSFRQQWRYVTTLWRDPEIFGIEQLVLMAVVAGRFVLPSMLVNKVAGKLSYPNNKRTIELWVAVKPLLLLFLLGMGYGARRWMVVLAIYLLADSTCTSLARFC